MLVDKNINILFLKHIIHDYLDYHVDEVDKYFNKSLSLNYADYFLKHGMNGLHLEIERLIDEHNIELIFISSYWNIFQLPPEFINSLRSRCRIIFWLFDDETFLHVHTKYFAQTADFIISTDTLGQSYYEAIGIPTYRYASFYPKEIYCPDKDTTQDIDVSFVGAVGKGCRTEYLNHLLENGIKLECWGNGTERGMVSFEEMVQIFRRSKINLNFVDMEEFDWICERFPLSRRIKQKKGRQIEISLTNSLCLQEYCPDLKYYFDPDVEMPVFRTKEEMLEKIKYYLANEAERKAICEKGYQKSLANYEAGTGFPLMFGTMLNEINKNEPYRELQLPIYLDAFYHKRYSAFLWLYLLIFLKNRKFGMAFDLLKRLWRQPKTSIVRGMFYALRKKTPSAKRKLKYLN